MTDVLDANALDDLEPVQTPPADDGNGDGSQNPPDGGNGNQQQEDLTVDLLRGMGITDPTKIKFETDDGSMEERDWKDLTKEEKLAILSPQSDYSEAEVDLIKSIRDSQQTPDEYLEQIRQEAASAVQPDTVYEIDSMSDDELYVLDIIDKLGEENVTDEQLQSMLTNAKSDEALYQKTIEALRTQYKQREDDLKIQKQQEAQAQQEQVFNSFSESILKEIKSLKEVAGKEIELTTDDMNELANFILTRDENGNSEFGKAMNDPKLFTQMAFWALKGNDIMNEISSQIKLAYEHGIEEGKKGHSSLVIDKSKDGNKPNSNNNPKSNSAASLDFD